jgi:hypothetical protein
MKTKLIKYSIISKSEHCKTYLLLLFLKLKVQTSGGGITASRNMSDLESLKYHKSFEKEYGRCVSFHLKLSF